LLKLAGARPAEQVLIAPTGPTARLTLAMLIAGGLFLLRRRMAR